MKRAILFLAILAFCFISCDDLFDDDDEKGKHPKTAEKKVKDIKYTVKPDNNTDTKNIVFSFAKEIKGLKEKDIHIQNKSGSVIKGKLSGKGDSWSLKVITSAAGKIEVEIKKPGIEGKKKKVNVYLWVNADLPEELDCTQCGEQDCCDECEQNCGEQDCECIEYDCYSCKDQGCGECTVIAY